MTRTESRLVPLTLYFLKIGATVFGGPVALVENMQRELIEERRWLTPQDFNEALALDQLTPGPVVITVGFIGYLVAGLAGASLAALGVFLPVYLLVLLLAPWFHRHGNQPQLAPFAEGVTASAVGALTGAVFLIAPSSVHDLAAGGIALLSLLLIVATKIPEPALFIFAGIAGLFLYKG